MTTGPYRRVVNRLRHLTAAAPPQVSDAALLDRFVAEHDEGAFALLVQRHGAMVLGVCQRVLRHVQEAEDAFQATFFVLARKAASISQREALGSWLYGVAHRTALKARAGARRRQLHEQASADSAQVLADAPDDHGLSEVLDTELNRLPAKYRTALILFHLDGRGVEESARQLGWSVGQFRGALHRGRQLLQERLRRHAPALGATMLFSPERRAAVPPGLVDATAQAAPLVAAGGTAVGSAAVVSLSQGVQRDMLLAKLKLVVLVLATLLAGAGSGAVGYRVLAEPPVAPAPAVPAPPPAVPAPPPPVDAAPDVVVSVPSQRDGLVADLRVKVGDRVQEGQVLARLDDRLALAETDKAKARLAAAEADVILAERTRSEAGKRLETAIILHDKKAISAEDLQAQRHTFDRCAADLVAKEHGVNLAKIDIRLAEVILRMHDIRSPVGGVVTQLRIKKGEAVRQFDVVFRIDPSPRQN